MTHRYRLSTTPDQGKLWNMPLPQVPTTDPGLEKVKIDNCELSDSTCSPITPNTDGIVNLYGTFKIPCDSIADLNSGVSMNGLHILSWLLEDSEKHAAEFYDGYFPYNSNAGRGCGLLKRIERTDIKRSIHAKIPLRSNANGFQ